MPPLFPSKLGSYWWLDDDKLMYPFYEKAVKSGITTVCIHNSARLYNLRPKIAQHGITTDKIAAIKAEYLAAGGARTNARYGFVARSTA